MLHFRRLPPFLRVIVLVALMLPLAALTLLWQTVPALLSITAWPANSQRVFAITSSLVLLGLSCSSMVATYNTPFATRIRDHSLSIPGRAKCEPWCWQPFSLWVRSRGRCSFLLINQAWVTTVSSSSRWQHAYP